MLLVVFWLCWLALSAAQTTQQHNFTPTAPSTRQDNVTATAVTATTPGVRPPGTTFAILQAIVWSQSVLNDTVTELLLHTVTADILKQQPDLKFNLTLRKITLLSTSRVSSRDPDMNRGGR